MNTFDYFFESSKNLEKDVILGKENTSYKKLYEDSLKVAHYLTNSIGQGNNVILIAPNSAFFITVYLGILKSGNVCVPLNSAIEQENLDFILKETEGDTIFATTAILVKLNLGECKHIYDQEAFFKILEETPTKNIEEEFDGNRMAEIIFTSGSTGKPKGVMISHNNIIANTGSIVSYLKLTSDDIICIVLPFYYCYGLSLLHTHLRVGGSIVLNNSFIFLGSVINDLKKYNCTGFSGVPSHYQILLKKSQTFKKTKFPSLKYVTQAGGKLHSVFIKEFIDAFPSIDFFVMYGQTEATARLSYMDPIILRNKLGSIGKAIPGVNLKIVNENGFKVSAGEEGELLAKGGNIMLGYYKDSELTSETIHNGWLKTGDIAKYDEDGFIYIVARKKEFIKVGGKRVSPKEIEEVILSVPEVVDCTLRGSDDDLLGEAIEAIIVPQDGIDNEKLKETILVKCGKNLAMYKVPKKITFEKRMNVSASGKKVKN